MARLPKELHFKGGKLRFLADLCLGTRGKHSEQLVHLVKVLPRLRQSASVWLQTLDKCLQSIGMERGKHRPAVYTHSDPQSRVYLAACVDNLTLFGKQEHLVRLKSDLECIFELKFLGNANYLLDVTISRVGTKVLLSQEDFVNKVLAKHGLEKFSPRYTLLDVGTVNALSGKYPDNERLSAESSTTYKSMIGLILYTSMVDSDVRNFTNPDFARDLADQKSTSGITIYAFVSLIYRRSRKQSVVAESTADAEFVASATAMLEAQWIMQVMQEIGIEAGVLKLFNDN